MSNATELARLQAELAEQAKMELQTAIIMAARALTPETKHTPDERRKVHAALTEMADAIIAEARRPQPEPSERVDTFWANGHLVGERRTPMADQ